MFKALITGVTIGAGMIIGAAGAALIGWYTIADNLERADAKAIAGLERANAAISEAFPAPRVLDNLEYYRACLHANDAGDSAATVDACRESFRDWEDSPTFALELEKLQRIDIRVAEIMTEYDNNHPNRYFD